MLVTGVYKDSHMKVHQKNAYVKSTLLAGIHFLLLHMKGKENIGKKDLKVLGGGKHGNLRGNLTNFSSSYAALTLEAITLLSPTCLQWWDSKV